MTSPEAPDEARRPLEELLRPAALPAALPAPSGQGRWLRERSRSDLVLGALALLLAISGALLLVRAGTADGEAGDGRPPSASIADASRGGPTPTPDAGPTYGVYVPPPPITAEATLQRPAPPAKKASSRPRRPSSTGPRCPPGWENVPFLRRWCESHGMRPD